MIEHGLSAKPINDGKELRLRCPLCGDHKERMFLNAQTYLWTCHNCQEAGNLYGFLERVLDLDPLETYRAVREIDTRTFPSYVRTEKGELKAVEIPDSVPLKNLSSPIEKPFWDYLLGRGLTPSTVQQYWMSACATGPYGMRVIIPVYQEGVLVSFIARLIHDGGRKVLYPEGAEMARMLFDLDRVAGREEVILVEGAFDAIRLSGRAVATLGAGLSAEQRALLRKAGFQKITILYDPDEAGRKASIKAARELVSAGFDVRVALLPEGDDPASAPSRILDKALDSAVPIEVLSSATELRRFIE